MVKLYIVRHGQSVANVNNVFLGQTDMDLTELGFEQARLTANYLKDIPVDKIYSSDLQRAHNTALPVSELTGIPITDAKELREICAGIWEGRLANEIEIEYEKEFRTWRKDYSNARLPGGESVQEVYERVIPFVKQIARENDGLTILFASHASPVRAVDCNAQGWGWQKMSDVPFVKNSAISIFEYDPATDTLSPVERNITEHLAPAMISNIPKGLRN
jgi:broad specificity phosphatase PhoE